MLRGAVIAAGEYEAIAVWQFVLRDRVHGLLRYRKDKVIFEEHNQYARILDMLDSAARGIYRLEYIKPDMVYFIIEHGSHRIPKAGTFVVSSKAGTLTWKGLP